MNRRDMASYEWRKDLRLKDDILDWEDVDNVFPKFVPALQKMGFNLTRKIIYNCMYKSDKPSMKFVLHGKNKSGTMDKVLLFSCIHNYEFELVLSGETFRSGPCASVAATEQMFRDFVLEKYPWFLNCALLLKRDPNESKILYNHYQTSNRKLQRAGLKMLLTKDLSLRQIMFLFLILALKRNLITTK